MSAAAAATVTAVEVTEICCIGAGYVGAITMTIIAQHCPDMRIVVVDVNQAKIDQWNSEDLPLYEPGLKEIILTCRGTLTVFFELKRLSPSRQEPLLLHRCRRLYP